MDLQARCQVLDDADARHLVVLLNAAHVPSAGSQELVLLGRTPDCAQRFRRTTKVGLWRNILSRHCPGFRSTRPKRPRPIGLICPCRSTKPSLQRSRNMHLMRRSSALHMRRETRIIGFQIILDKRPSKRPALALHSLSRHGLTFFDRDGHLASTPPQPQGSVYRESGFTKNWLSRPSVPREAGTLLKNNGA